MSTWMNILAGSFWMLTSTTLAVFAWVSIGRRRDAALKEHASAFLEPQDPTRKRVDLRPELYYSGLRAWVVGILLTLGFLVLPFWSVAPMVWSITPAMVLGTVLAIHVGRAVWSIPIDSRGALTFLGGKATKVFAPGVYLAPRVLFVRHNVYVGDNEIYLPGPDNAIFWGDDKETVPDGKVRAWRMVTGAPTATGVLDTNTTKPSDKADSKDTKKEILQSVPTQTNQLDVQTVVGVKGFAMWRVRDDRIYEFILAANNEMAQVNQQILGLSQPCLAQAIGMHPLSWVMINTAEISETLRKTLSGAMERYGVEISTARIDSPNISHDLAKKLTAAVEARAAANAKNTEAVGEAAAIIRKADADAHRARILLAAEGEGIRDGAEAAGVSAEEFLAAKVAERTIGAGSTIALGTDGLTTALGGLGKLTQQAIKSNVPTKKEAT